MNLKNYKKWKKKIFKIFFKAKKNLENLKGSENRLFFRKGKIGTWKEELFM